MPAENHSQPCIICSFNPEIVAVQKELMLGLCKCVKHGKEQESDEYASHYCCNVMTSLMSSMETLASHFVVSPVLSPAQEIQHGIVLGHIHSDGWMHLLIF